MLHYILDGNLNTQKGAILTTLGGTLSFISAFLETGELTHSFILGAAGAAGALFFTLFVAGLRKFVKFVKNKYGKKSN